MNYAGTEWAEFAARVEVEKDRVKASLCEDCDERKTADLRGQLRALNRILQWPQNDAAKTPEIGVDFNL